MTQGPPASSVEHRNTLLNVVRDLIRLVNFAPRVGRRLLVQAILASALAASADIASLLLLQKTVMTLTGLAQGGAPGSLNGIFAFLLATMIGSLMRLWAQRLATIAQFTVGLALITTAFRNLQYQSYPDYIAHGASEGFVALERLQTICFNVLAPFVTGIAAFVMSSVMLITIVVLYPLSILPIGVTGAAAGLWAYSNMKRKTWRGGTSHLAQMRAKLLYESRTVFRDLSLINGQTRMFTDFSDIEHRLRDRQARIALGAQSVRYPLEIVVVALAIAFLLLVPAATTAHLRAIPALGILGLAALRLIPSLATLRSSAHLLRLHGDVIGDALALLRREAHPTVSPTGTLKLRREIKLVNISVIRSDRSPILRALELRIGRGERIGIVGESGAGKSTLLDLICGILPPSSGTVLIDSMPLDSAQAWVWRERIGVVSQNPILLGDTLREAICYPERPANADLQRLKDAARNAGVDAMADTFPDGLDTRTGEALSRLSGGQRQRLALAHALYRARDLLVLDEATGQLDVESERAVLAAIANLSREIAVIIVSHRPTLLACCDITYSLAGGKLEVVDAAF